MCCCGKDQYTFRWQGYDVSTRVLDVLEANGILDVLEANGVEVVIPSELNQTEKGITIGKNTNGDI